MPTPTLSKDEVVDRLFGVFRDYGYEGGTLTVLSKATGLGRSTLYYYFPGGKAEMVTAVVARARAWIDANLLEIAGGDSPPRERLAIMLKAFETLYAGGKQGCVLGHLALGDTEHILSSALRASFEAWITAFEQLARDAGHAPRAARMRAEDAVAAIQGALIVAIAGGDRSVFHRALTGLADRLLH